MQCGEGDIDDDDDDDAEHGQCVMNVSLLLLERKDSVLV